VFLTGKQLQSYQEDGFLILPELFSPAEVSVIRRAMDRVFAQESEANIKEKGSEVVRLAMGLHQRDDVFARLARHPRLLEPAEQLAGPRLYLQQCKINVKAAFAGEVWQWHQDFSNHHAEDGVPEPLAINLHVFIDEVNEFNGPLYFIRGSHRAGRAPTVHDTTSTSYALWVVDPQTVRELTIAGGLVSATGRPGTALIFGDYLVHGSPSNLSPWNRAIFSIIVNPISNHYTQDKRPDFVHHKDLTPITPLGDNCLLES
jgi:ectoine hydroxylase